MNTIEEMALRLFNHEHPDAIPNLLLTQWENDPTLRAIWIKRVEVVLGVSE